MFFGGEELQDSFLEGVIRASDYLAMGAIRAIRERGLEIPADMAVVGYDDIEMVLLLEVPLTTIYTPKYRLGEKAVKIFLDHLVGEKDDCEKN